MRLLITIGLILLLLPITAATAQTIGVYSDTNGQSVCSNLASPVQELYIVYTGGGPIKAIEFSAPLPYCVTGAAVIDVPVYPFVGSSQTLASVNLGGCTSPPVHVLTIQVIAGQLTETCCFWEFFNVQAVDCNDDVISFGGGSWLSTEPCDLSAPNTPGPPDGATSVPLSVDLEWVSGPPLPGCGLGDVLVHRLLFGTDPGALMSRFDVGSPFPVSDLSPGTTYYWQVEATTYNLAGPVPSPLWSFTTTGPVPVQRSTWGAVKALFE